MRAVIVYNNNPVAVCPDSSKVVAGFSREDLFCVVMDSFLTDTADYADIVLPATTQLEHTDIHKSYGHLYVLANNPAIAPVGESLPNAEVFRRLAARMGFDEDCFRDCDDELARQAIGSGHANLAGIDWETLKKNGWQRLALPEKFAPFAKGGFHTPSGKCEFYSEALKAQGIDPLPFYNPPAELPSSNPQLASKYPLSFLSPPLRNFLNSSFANLPRFRDEEGEPHLELHADGRGAARHRGRRPGARVQRPRQLHAARARQRQAAPRRGGGALGVVEEILGRPAQRQRADLASARRTWAARRPSTTAWSRSSSPPDARHEPSVGVFARKRNRRAAFPAADRPACVA